jgi:hypothetical protein
MGCAEALENRGGMRLMSKKVVISLTPYEAETLFVGLSNYWHKPWRLAALNRVLRKIQRARWRLK